jgi:hypothetical protein
MSNLKESDIEQQTYDAIALVTNAYAEKLLQLGVKAYVIAILTPNAELTVSAAYGDPSIMMGLGEKVKLIGRLKEIERRDRITKIIGEKDTEEHEQKELEL